jgi:hypothetical protein
MPFTLTDEQAEELIKAANRLGSIRAACFEAGMDDRTYNCAKQALRHYRDRNGYEVHGRQRTRIIKRKRVA